MPAVPPPAAHRYSPAGREVLATVQQLAQLEALTAADIAALTFVHYCMPGRPMTTPETHVQELAQMGQVDTHPDVHRATDDAEEAELRELYGAPDTDGIYRGQGA